MVRQVTLGKACWVRVRQAWQLKASHAMARSGGAGDAGWGVNRNGQERYGLDRQARNGLESPCGVSHAEVAGAPRMETSLGLDLFAPLGDSCGQVRSSYERHRL